MSKKSYKNICVYYDTKSKVRNSETEAFTKFCFICNLEVILKYSRCPYCHNSFENALLRTKSENKK